MDNRIPVSARRVLLLLSLAAMGYCAGQAAPHLPASLAGDPQLQDLAQRLNAAETTIAVMRSQWDDALWLGRGIFGAVATLVADRVWIAFKARA